jgi:hypothetical protein
MAAAPADWPPAMKPPGPSDAATTWQKWYDTHYDDIVKYLPAGLAKTLPDKKSKPTKARKAAIMGLLDKDTSALRIGLKMAAISTPSTPSPTSPSSTANTSPSSTTPPAHGVRNDCNYPRCTNVATSTDCPRCQDHCEDDDCAFPIHLTIRMRKERAALRRAQQQTAAAATAAGSLSFLFNALSAHHQAQTQTLPAAASGAGDSSTSAASAAPAPAGSVAEGPLSAAADPSVVWFQVIASWKLYPFAADDHDRVTAALDHISAAWSQRATLVFHKFFTATGPANITRRFVPKPPPEGTDPDEWESERSEKILAHVTTCNHITAICRAYARSRFVVPGKKKAIWFAITTAKKSNEFYAIEQAQLNIPTLDPANPTVPAECWSDPSKAFYWMLLASSFRIGFLRTGLETAVRDYGEAYRAANSSMFVAEPVHTARYSEEALQRKTDRGRPTSGDTTTAVQPFKLRRTDRNTAAEQQRRQQQLQGVARDTQRDQSLTTTVPTHDAPSGGAGDDAAITTRQTHGTDGGKGGNNGRPRATKPAGMSWKQWRLSRKQPANGSTKPGKQE